MIARLREGVQECIHTSTVLRIQSPDEAREIRRATFVGLSLALFGIGWMLLGRAFVPNWTIAEVYSRATAIPIWTFSMLVVMAGMAIVVLAFPRCRAACGRHPTLFFAFVIVAVVGWLVAFSWAGFLRD
jgi:uncharacterized membrane protein